ncbi:MAG: lysostaphin resistance A-like protein [Candidatus Thorarchaeota archaeon]
MREFEQESAAPITIRKELKTNLSDRQSPFLLVELIVVAMVLFLLSVTGGGIAFVVPIAYILLDTARRGRTWQELGLRQRTFTKDLYNNAGLVILSFAGIQSLIVWGGWLLLPSYLDYVLIHRAWSVQFDFGSFILILFSIPLTTMLEEVIFRGLFQERLSWFFGQGVSLFIASLLFAAIHWTPNDSIIVLIDLIAIAAGGLVYGVIYMRCKNIYISWCAHMLSDLYGLLLLFLIFNLL